MPGITHPGFDAEDEAFSIRVTWINKMMFVHSKLTMLNRFNIASCIKIIIIMMQLAILHLKGFSPLLLYVRPSVRHTIYFFGLCWFWSHCSCLNDEVILNMALLYLPCRCWQMREELLHCTCLRPSFSSLWRHPPESEMLGGKKGGGWSQWFWFAMFDYVTNWQVEKNKGLKWYFASIRSMIMFIPRWFPLWWGLSVSVLLCNRHFRRKRFQGNGRWVVHRAGVVGEEKKEKEKKNVFKKIILFARCWYQ